MCNIKQWPIALAMLISCTRADWQFRSRPDLSPPRLNITIPATPDIGDGFIFVAPYRGFIQSEGLDGPEQPGAYIFRSDGDLVWSSIGILDGWVGNFQANRWQGKDVLQAFQGTLDSFHGHGFGHNTLLDEHYESIREVRSANHRITSIHEFRIVDESSALIEIYQPTAMDLTKYGGTAGQQWIVDAVIQELDIRTGQLIFEWRSLENTDPLDSTISLTSGSAFNGINSSVAWDYFHANSVDKDQEGNYLISARHMSAIYKVNGTSGKVIWQLGGKRSDFKIPAELRFAYQHDARFRSTSTNGKKEVISFFDNASRSNGHRGGGVDQISDFSTAKFVQINTEGPRSEWSATLIHALPSPEHTLSTSQGNVQVLPNGNIFVNWGQAGIITEYRAKDLQPIFNAHLDSGIIGTGVQSYRAFRYGWKGSPNEVPAIVALLSKQTFSGSKPNATIYVSWNGDTETEKWRFYVHSGPNKVFLGEKNKTSFETAFSFHPDIGSLSHESSLIVSAEALGGSDRILSRTDRTKIQADVIRTSATDPLIYKDGGKQTVLAEL